MINLGYHRIVVTKTRKRTSMYNMYNPILIEATIFQNFVCIAFMLTYKSAPNKLST